MLVSDSLHISLEKFAVHTWLHDPVLNWVCQHTTTKLSLLLLTLGEYASEHRLLILALGQLLCVHVVPLLDLIYIHALRDRSRHHLLLPAHARALTCSGHRLLLLADRGPSHSPAYCTSVIYYTHTRLHRSLHLYLVFGHSELLTAQAGLLLLTELCSAATHRASCADIVTHACLHSSLHSLLFFAHAELVCFTLYWLILLLSLASPSKAHESTECSCCARHRRRHVIHDSTAVLVDTLLLAQPSAVRLSIIRIRPNQRLHDCLISLAIAV